MDFTKTIAITLTPNELRVLRNGVNKEWHHLQGIKTSLGVKIANEKDAEERDGMTGRYDNYSDQQAACDSLLLQLSAI